MRKVAFGLILLLTFGNLSCSEGDQDFLQIVIDNPKAYLIPAEIYSCKALATGSDNPDVQGKSFTVPRTRLRWYHAYNSLTVVQVRLSFTNSNLQGGKANCNIVDEELLAAGGGSQTIPANPYRSYDKFEEFEYSCRLKCGGFKTLEQNFVANGKLEVIGFMTTPEGEDQPVRASIPFSVENIE